MSSYLHRGVQSIKEEMQATLDAVRSTRWNLGFALALACVLFVIVGNVVLLIAINFWIVSFPEENLQHNSSQIAIQVVTMIFLVLLFSILGVIFTIIYGALPLWRILVDRNRAGHPAYRLFLLFCSGLTNGVSSILGVYAMTYTPEFIQAVLLCVIPFSAQAWTVIFIPIERKRNYLSMFFIASFVLFVAGVLLSSLSAFLHPDSSGEKAPWAWALLYLASSVVFGLWCVVQRLYLDAIVIKEPAVQVETAVLSREPGERRSSHQGYTEMTPKLERVCSCRECSTINQGHVIQSHFERSPVSPDALNPERSPVNCTKVIQYASVHCVYSEEDRRVADLSENEQLRHEPHDVLTGRPWSDENVDDSAAKLVLLIVSLSFQFIISFVLFPVDAIPWFGTSDTALEAWHGFCNSVDFIFSQWRCVRYGLLYTLGFAMSFIGCTYLNEHSPTLASVVLQLAGPITSLVIIIIPQWNVHKSDSHTGQSISGVLMLFVAALLYHLWEQQALRDGGAPVEEVTLEGEEMS